MLRVNQPPYHSLNGHSLIFMAEKKSKPSKTPNPNIFYENLRKSGLVADSKIHAAVEAVKVEHDGVEFPAKQLMDWCITNGLVTAWQGKKLATGNHKGFHLGQYVLEDIIGAGGMSAVFRARHQLTNQHRAIKILPKSRLTEKSYLTRFYREGRAVAALKHVNIIRIYDIAEENQTHYMVIEFVPGTDLHQFISKNGLPKFDLARECIKQAAAGLGHAHENNIIHRDVKPANLLLADDGTVKVLDLGLALLKKNRLENELSKAHNERMMGTADYLAPEQAVDSHEIDRRADIYSLGCSLYFLLTGQPPFPEGTLAQRIAGHQFREPTAISKLRPDCPRELESICQKMMSKEPDDRFQTCDQVIEAIDRNELVGIVRNKTVLASKSRSKRKRSGPQILFPLIALTALVGVLGYFAITKNDSGGNGTNQFEEASNTAKHLIEKPNPPGDRVVADTKPNPKAVTTKFYSIDFGEYSIEQSSDKIWQMMYQGTPFGSLRNGKKKIVDTPQDQVNFGEHSLHLKAHPKDFSEFRPENKQNKFQFVSFYALSTSLDVEMVLEGRHIKPGKRWIELPNDTKLSPEKWTKFEFFADSFDAINAEKFRFKITGEEGEGVYIDNLTIEFK